MVSRPDFWWPTVFWDRAQRKDKAFFAAVHSDADGVDDGFVAYEISGDWNGGLPERRLLVWDMQAVDAGRARRAVAVTCFGVDLVGTVAATNVPIDDPLRHLVVDARRVRVDFVNDGLWLAPLDPLPLLASRTYTVAGRVVHRSARARRRGRRPTPSRAIPRAAVPHHNGSRRPRRARTATSRRVHPRREPLDGAGAAPGSSKRAMPTCWSAPTPMFMATPAPALLTSF